MYRPKTMENKLPRICKTGDFMHSYSLAAVLSLIVLSTVSMLGCMTYTYADAQSAIPAVSSIPSEEPISTFAKKEERPLTENAAIIPLSAALVPLPQGASQSLLDAVVSSVNHGKIDVIAFTGDEQTISSLVDTATLPLVRLDERSALATTLKIIEQKDATLVVEAADGKRVRIAVANLQHITVLESFLASKEWEEEVFRLHEKRLALIQPLVETDDELPFLFLASLAEPASTDWSSPSVDYPYRRAFAWPMVDYLEQQGFFDSYRLTHYSAGTDAGITFKLTTPSYTLGERIDYLFIRGLLPLETDTKALPCNDWEGYGKEERFALTGLFVVP